MARENLYTMNNSTLNDDDAEKQRARYGEFVHVDRDGLPFVGPLR